MRLAYKIIQELQIHVQLPKVGCLEGAGLQLDRNSGLQLRQG